MGQKWATPKIASCSPMVGEPSRGKGNVNSRMNNILFFAAVHHEKNGKDQSNGDSSKNGDHHDAIVP